MTTKTCIRTASAILLAGCLAGSAWAAAPALPADIKARGTLTAGIVPNYPPLDLRNPASNALTGFDVDLGTALAARLGVRMDWQETSFEQMLPSVRTGRLDIVLSGMSDLPSRRSAASFIDYLRSGVQFFTQASRAAEFPDMSALCGRTVGASRRTSLPAEIKRWSDVHCVAAKRAPVTVVGTEGSADARTQLRQGRVDAAMQGSETLPYIMKNEPGIYARIGQPIRWTLIGIATAREADALRAALAGALNAMIADGSYRALLVKWQLDENGVSSAQIDKGE